MLAAVIDTHALIWYLYGDPRLSSRAKEFIFRANDSGNQVAVSSISLVEMVYLIEKRRIAAESLSLVAANLNDPDNLLTEAILNVDVARALSRISVVQIPDMPDRIIAATALHLNVPVISRDAKIASSDIQTIW
ncbi:MAG: type II toxin-antitoxin system VapC family toxin [Anaerolineae bacterium]|nr:type II toxin-antitoxin system VapC family toxin [Anaerolineae bacterium]